MKTTILGTLLLSLALAPQSFANPNACDDYIARHYRKDLKAIGLSFVDKDMMGDIHFPHQRVMLKVKNVGEVAFGGSGYKRMSVNVAGQIEDVQLAFPLASGATRTVYLNVPPGTLQHCAYEPVRVDRTHSIGQWGCQVWNNDGTSLRAFRLGAGNCIQIKPIKPKPKYPIKPIRP